MLTVYLACRVLLSYRTIHITINEAARFFFSLNLALYRLLSLKSMLFHYSFIVLGLFYLCVLGFYISFLLTVACLYGSVTNYKRKYGTTGDMMETSGRQYVKMKKWYPPVWFLSAFGKYKIYLNILKIRSLIIFGLQWTLCCILITLQRWTYSGLHTKSITAQKTTTSLQRWDSLWPSSWAPG